MNGDPQTQAATRVFRGRSLEDVIPQIKEELGADAVITRRREGLAGGIGGFFQRPFIEVEARAGEAPASPERRFEPGAPRRVDVYDDAPAGPPPYAPAPAAGLDAELDFSPDAPVAAGPGRRGADGEHPETAFSSRTEGAPAEGGPPDDLERDPGAAGDPPAGGLPPASAADLAPDDEAGPDPATAEGLASPAIRAVVDQAAPFVEAEGRALAGRPEGVPAAVPAAAASPFARELELAQARRRAPEGEPAPLERRGVGAARAGLVRPGAGQARPPAARERPPAADALERALAESGLSPGMAAEVVAETVSHLLPFGSSRGLKRLARLALARRIPVQGTLSGGRRAAFVGAGGAGKTLCAARLAAAYAAGSDLAVACLTLDDDEGAARLAGLLDEAGIEVRRFGDDDEAAAWLASLPEHAVVVVDTPSVSPADEAQVRRLARRLRKLSPSEVHLALPATTGAGAARDLLAGLRPLRPACLALTHVDETAHPGAVLEVAVETPLAISYVSRGTGVPGGLEPAEPATLATLVLP